MDRRRCGADYSRKKIATIPSGGSPSFDNYSSGGETQDGSVGGGYVTGGGGDSDMIF